MKYRISQFLVVPAIAIITTIGASDDVSANDRLPDTIRQRQDVIVKLFGAGLGELDSYGSGVLISEQGHVATVWNHLINTGFLTAVTADGHRYEVDVVGTSARHDVAVLKLQAQEQQTFPYVRLQNCIDPPAGESVIAFSNMFHVATGNEPVSAVHGVIACKSPLNAGLGKWDFPVETPVYILDAITNNSGAAGGLLTTLDGQPVGLLGREIRHRESRAWVNYAVPLTTLKPVLESMVAGRVIETSPDEDSSASALISDRQLTSNYGITLLPSVVERTPAFVDRIVPGSIADQAGFKRGDLIVLMNDRVIQSVTDFRRMIQSYRSGESLNIVVNRQERLVPLNLRVQ